MKAYKGFRNDLTCTMGKGTYQFEIGKWHTEKKAKCCSTGFHCTDNPLDVLNYYSREDDRYFIVEASGDIHEDDVNSRIACTKMKLVKEISLTQLVVAGLLFMKEHPKRKNSSVVRKEEGVANDGFVIVRGKHPKAAGKKGSVLYLAKDGDDGLIEEIGAYEVDGEIIKADKYYNVRGERVYEKKRVRKAKNT